MKRYNLITIALLMTLLLTLSGCIQKNTRLDIESTSPFVLAVTEPKDQSIVSTSPISLSGFTATNAVVSINGVTISLDETGLFTTSVSLTPGPNIIDIVATDTDGAVMSAILAVIYRP